MAWIGRAFCVAVLHVVLSVATARAVPAGEAEAPSAGEALAQAEGLWFQALLAGLSSADPVVVAAAADRIVSANPKPVARDARRRNIVGKASESLRGPLYRLIASPPGDDRQASRVREACFAAIIRIGAIPTDAELAVLETVLGKPAILLLASRSPHDHLATLRRGLDAPDPIDLAHILAWNQLVIHEAEPLIRRCWDGMRVHVVAQIYDGEQMIGVPRVDDDGMATVQQDIHGILLKNSAWSGDVVLDEVEAPFVRLWMRPNDRLEPGRAGQAANLATARLWLLHHCARISDASGDETRGLATGTSPSIRLELTSNEDVTRAVELATERANSAIASWRDLRKRLRAYAQVETGTDHPPIAVTIRSYKDGVVRAFTIEPSPPK